MLGNAANIREGPEAGTNETLIRCLQHLNSSSPAPRDPPSQNMDAISFVHGDQRQLRDLQL